MTTLHIWVTRAKCDCGYIWTTQGSPSVVCSCGGLQIINENVIGNSLSIDEIEFKQFVANEIGIDITSHESNTLDEITAEIGTVITVCKNAHDTCPVFPGEAVVIHHGFDDPPYLAKDMTDDESILPVYRRVRDEIKVFIENL